MVTGNASVTLVVGGVTLTRDTDPATAGVPAGTGRQRPGGQDLRRRADRPRVR